MILLFRLMLVNIVKESMLIIIYKIENKLDGKIYVGQTRQTLRKRIAAHKRLNYPIGFALRKYGIENFEITILETCETLEQLNEREIFCHEQKSQTMKQYCATPEAHAKKSAVMIERYSNPVEHEKQSARMTERFSKPEECDKMSSILKKVYREHGDEIRKNKRFIRCAEIGEIFQSITVAANFYKINISNITSACRGRLQTAGGFHWQYVESENSM